MSTSNTPNVVVQNPKVRKVASWIIGISAIAFPALSVFDGRAEWVDMSAWLDPAIATTSFLAGVFGLAVIVPNIPKVGKYGDYSQGVSE